jgi:hypothetical protein
MKTRIFNKKTQIQRKSSAAVARNNGAPKTAAHGGSWRRLAPTFSAQADGDRLHRFA